MPFRCFERVQKCLRCVDHVECFSGVARVFRDVERVARVLRDVECVEGVLRKC